MPGVLSEPNPVSILMPDVSDTLHGTVLQDEPSLYTTSPQGGGISPLILVVYERAFYERRAFDDKAHQ